MKKTKGFICVIIAAIIFGYTPILSKLTYSGGSNSIMLVFLRNILCLPVLFIMLKIKKIDMKISKQENKKLIILSLLTSTFTALLLYSSYIFISVGMATTIHYVYPILVALISVIFFKEKISMVKIISLVLSFTGILMFFDGKLSPNILGMLIALASGITYGVGLIYMDKSGVKNLYPFLVTFYTCIYASIFLFIISLVTGKFTLQLTSTAWIYSIIISLLTSVIAITFMQIGVCNVGPITTAILCMFEPIGSVIFGIIILHEPCTIRSVLGCILVMSAVIILSVFKEKSKLNSKV